MSDTLLLDTHVALWLDSGDPRLKKSTRTLIDDCWRQDGTIFLSAVSAWEIAVLADKAYIELDLPVDRWLTRFLDRPGVEPAPLDHATAALAYDLRHWPHRDPGDRLLIASAIGLGCPLVTYDENIRRYGQSRGRQYGFGIAG